MDLSGKNFTVIGSLLGGLGPTAERATGAPQVKPKPGEGTGPQNTVAALPMMAPGGGWGFLPFMTGTSSQAFPAGVWGVNGSPLFPGVPIALAGAFFGWMGSYGMIQPRRGSYWTYRLMDLNPTLALVRALIVGPILSSQWEVTPSDWAQSAMPSTQKKGKNKQQAKPDWRPKIDGQTLANAVQLIEDMMTPKLRRDYLDEATRFLSFGWRGFEKVWSLRSGYWWFDKAKSLLPDWTQILHDGTGKFSGLTQRTVDGEALGPEKSFIVTYNGESGNLYGLPRHETAYDTYADWQSTRLRESLYEGKMSGRFPTLHFKPGRTEMPPGSGTFVDNAAISQQILSTVVEGRGVAIPDLQYEDAMLMQNPKLAGVSPWVLEMEDGGQNSEMLKGFQSIMEYKDKLLVRSWCWPERALLEAHHGTRADAQAHTDTATIDREVIDDGLAGDFSQCVIDDVLTLNFGEAYRGAVTVNPAPLVDQKVEVYEKLLEAMMGNQMVAPEVLADMDIEEVMNHLDIGLQDDQNLNERIRNLAEVQQEKAQQQLTAGAVSKPAGKGPAKGRMAEK